MEESDSGLRQPSDGAGAKGSPLVSWRVLIGFAAVVSSLFFFMEALFDGWSGFHRYGIAPDGRNWAQLLPAAEGRLYLGLLLFAPLMLLFGGWATTQRWTEVALVKLQQHHRPITWFAALFAFAAAWLVGHVLLQQTPITDDEWAYLHHARVLASGAWTIQSPVDPAFYDNVFLINNGQWYSQYPVGNPMFLALGVLLTDPWLAPALACGAIVGLLAGISRELFGDQARSVTAVLAASSPFLLALSGTLLAHTPCLLWLSLFFWSGLAATRREGSPGWAVLSAVAFGLAVLTRPVSAVLVGLPLFLILWRRSGNCEGRWLKRLLFGLTGLLAVAFQLWVNDRCNGHPLRSAYFVYWLEPGEWRNPFGFGEFLWRIEHTPRTALDNLWHNALRLDAWLLGWPLSLALPLSAVVSPKRFDAAVLLAAAISPFALYFFFFWPGIADVGPVLYAESMLAWLVLAGAAVTRGSSARRRFCVGLLSIGIVVNVSVFQRIQVDLLGDLAAEASLVETFVMDRVGEDKALVFCDFREPTELQRSWVVGHPNPGPDLEDRVLFVTYQAPDLNHTFAHHRYADRVPYRLLRDARSGLRLVPLQDKPISDW